MSERWRKENLREDRDRAEEYTAEKEDKAFEELEMKLKKCQLEKDVTKTQGKTRPSVPHYQQGQSEPIDFINSHDMSFNLGNAVKYITRCNHKGTKQDDLKKAIDYLNFELERFQK